LWLRNILLTRGRILIANETIPDVKYFLRTSENYGVLIMPFVLLCLQEGLRLPLPQSVTFGKAGTSKNGARISEILFYYDLPFKADAKILAGGIYRVLPNEAVIDLDACRHFGNNICRVIIESLKKLDSLLASRFKRISVEYVQIGVSLLNQSNVVECRKGAGQLLFLYNKYGDDTYLNLVPYGLSIIQRVEQRIYDSMIGKRIKADAWSNLNKYLGMLLCQLNEGKFRSKMIEPWVYKMWCDIQVFSFDHANESVGLPLTTTFRSKLPMERDISRCILGTAIVDVPPKLKLTSFLKRIFGPAVNFKRLLVLYFALLIS
jgi:hypothetical protein